MLVLEEAGHAQRRGGRPIAEIAGWAAGGDAQTMTTLPESPETLVYTIAQALRRAEIDAQTVGHVNCHGTATSTNDPWETRAIHDAFREHAQRLHLTANKSMIGHLLGAAGSVELAMTALALRDQFVPPTMNLQEPDPLCDLDYTPDIGLATGFEAALKLSFGFGGHTAAGSAAPAPIDSERLVLCTTHQHPAHAARRFLTPRAVEGEQQNGKSKLEAPNERAPTGRFPRHLPAAARLLIYRVRTMYCHWNVGTFRWGSFHFAGETLFG